MRTCSFIIITLAILLATDLYAIKTKEVDTKDPTYRSWVYYKNALNEYNKGNYELALDNAQRSNMFRPNKKSRKLVQQIQELGYNYFKTGTALINFDQKLAKQHLSKAQVLIDQRDKKTLKKIEDSLTSLEQVE